LTKEVTVAIDLIDLLQKTIKYAIEKQPNALLVLFSIVWKYVKQEQERIKAINEAEIKSLGETFSISVEQLKEGLEVLKQAEIRQTGPYSFEISPFKKKSQ
jgi:hypothetical protein